MKRHEIVIAILRAMPVLGPGARRPDVTIAVRVDARHQAARYKGGPGPWARAVSFETPVDVSVTRPKRFVLEDGHHRYLAASILGRKLPAKIIIKGKPIEELLRRMGVQ